MPIVLLSFILFWNCFIWKLHKQAASQLSGVLSRICGRWWWEVEAGLRHVGNFYKRRGRPGSMMCSAVSRDCWRDSRLLVTSSLTVSEVTVHSHMWRTEKQEKIKEREDHWSVSSLPLTALFAESPPVICLKFLKVISFSAAASPLSGQLWGDVCPLETVNVSEWHLKLCQTQKTKMIGTFSNLFSCSSPPSHSSCICRTFM